MFTGKMLSNYQQLSKDSTLDYIESNLPERGCRKCKLYCKTHILEWPNFHISKDHILKRSHFPSSRVFIPETFIHINQHISLDHSLLLSQINQLDKYSIDKVKENCLQHIYCLQHLYINSKGKHPYIYLQKDNIVNCRHYNYLQLKSMQNISKSNRNMYQLKNKQQVVKLKHSYLNKSICLSGNDQNKKVIHPESAMKGLHMYPRSQH